MTRCCKVPSSPISPRNRRFSSGRKNFRTICEHAASLLARKVRWVKMRQEQCSSLSCELAPERNERRRAQESSADLCLDQLRRGDIGASHRLVQQLYPHVYRYLLYLIGNPETASDLTQETFVHAWRGLDTFEGRVPLLHWLYRIAYREFLQELRRCRSDVSLDRISEPSD